MSQLVGLYYVWLNDERDREREQLEVAMMKLYYKLCNRNLESVGQKNPKKNQNNFVPD